MKELLKRSGLALYYDNSDIVHFYRDNIRYDNLETKREQTKLAVIDDEPFSPQTNLSSYGYKAEPLGDIKRINEVASYHIILCDIMGVGRHFDNNLQGASLISEIKATFPEKVVIAYTGAMLNQSAARQAGLRADKIIKKDIEIEEWISTLDKYSDEVMNPYIVWNKIRRRLVELDVKTKDIVRLEDAYVRSIRSKDSSFSQLSATVGAIGLGQDVRSVLQGVVGSYIFRVIFGG